jgi:uncharacterized protein
MIKEINGMTLDEKYENLKNNLLQMQSVAIGYSGGVDSTLLLKVSHDVLGERAIGITIVSPSLPKSELEEAKRIAEKIGVKHILLKGREFEDPQYIQNSPDRCYFCKQDVFTLMFEYSNPHGYQYILDGTNADDANDHRPGRKAALQRGVRSPLLETGFSKADIRNLAKQLGLENWNRPSAACLASRIPYGTAIDADRLQQIELAEELLHEMGFSQVRVRWHDKIARIETEADNFSKLLELRIPITEGLNKLGFTYVTLDLNGFRSGSMNEVLEKDG